MKVENLFLIVALAFFTTTQSISILQEAETMQGMKKVVDVTTQHELKEQSAHYALRAFFKPNAVFDSYLTDEQRSYSYTKKMEYIAQKLNEKPELLSIIFSKISPEFFLGLDVISEKYWSKEPKLLALLAVALETSALEIACALKEAAITTQPSDSDKYLTYYFPARDFCSNTEIHTLVQYSRKVAKKLLNIAANKKGRNGCKKAIQYAKEYIFSDLTTEEYIESSSNEIKNMYEQHKNQTKKHFQTTKLYEQFLRFENKLESPAGTITDALSYPKTFTSNIAYDILHAQKKVIANKIVTNALSQLRNDDMYEKIMKCDALFSLLTNGEIWNGKLELILKAISKYKVRKANEPLIDYIDILKYLSEDENRNAIRNTLQDFSQPQEVSSLKKNLQKLRKSLLELSRSKDSTNKHGMHSIRKLFKKNTK